MQRTPLERGRAAAVCQVEPFAEGPSPDAAFTLPMLARTRRLFEQARGAGGTRYPIGSIPFTRLDWVRQYGDTWAPLIALKRRYDPDGILTPGPGILP